MARYSTQSYPIGSSEVTIYANQSRLNTDVKTSRLQAIALGANPEHIAQLITASCADDLGHKTIVHDVYEKISHADGIFLSKTNAAGVIQTADCPALILYNADSDDVVLAHAGRPALSPSDHCTSCTVVGNAVHALIGHDGNPSQVFALVVGNICGPCFKHDHEGAKHLIEPFLKLPETIFADRALGALDLYEVIKHQLIYHKIPAGNIRHEGPCTLETPELASYRRDKTPLRNTIIVVRS